jgi:hypothetical protein
MCRKKKEEIPLVKNQTNTLSTDDPANINRKAVIQEDMQKTQELIEGITNLLKDYDTKLKAELPNIVKNTMIDFIKEQQSKQQTPTQTTPEYNPELPSQQGAPIQGNPLLSILPQILPGILGGANQPQSDFQSKLMETFMTRAFNSMVFQDNMMNLMFSTWAKNLGVNMAQMALPQTTPQPEVKP